MLDNATTVLFTILLILIATGWGITYQTLAHLQDQLKSLAAIFCTYVVLYLVLFFWATFGVDSSKVYYVYSTVPGWILVAVRILTLLYFLFCLQVSS